MKIFTIQKQKYILEAETSKLFERIFAITKAQNHG